MSKKLSQSEIDALVASLLAGETSAGETPAESAASGPETAPDQPQGATEQVAASDIAALAATLAATPPSEPDLAAISAALAAKPSEPDPGATSAEQAETTGEPDPGATSAEQADTPSEPDLDALAAALAAAPSEPDLAAISAALSIPSAESELPPEFLPFEAIVDLGLITEAEVDQALNLFRAGNTPAPAHHAPQPKGKAPVKPAAAESAEAPSLPVMPPSNASYAASQAQAVAQTRRVLSMAALSGVVMDIELTVAVELGRARLSLGEVLALGPGSVVTLDKLANTQVDVKVNQVPLMKADVLAIGEKYGIRVTRSNLKVPAAS